MIRLPALVSLLCLLLIGCATTEPAPVIERAPAAKKPVPVNPASSRDWRPDTHTVKRGDTLYSIGLEYGYDYREIAQANNIAPPYVIHVGQVLKLKLLQQAEATPAAPAPATAADGVIITPLKTDSVAAVSEPEKLPAEQAKLLTEPRALREPYSELALASPTSPAEPAATTAQETPKSAAPQPTAAKPAASKVVTDASDNSALEWSWPTRGKLIAGFSDAGSARGIDIAGEKGQAVLAAASGKVIYSGADLRGYGKLVIIKHDKTYLSVYAHNSNILVKEGQQVTRGQKIAEMGNSDTDKTKLHFEIRQHGKSVDPARFLPDSPG